MENNQDLGFPPKQICLSNTSNEVQSKNELIVDWSLGIDENLWSEILFFLSLTDLFRFTRVSKKFNQLILSKKFWLIRFPGSFDQLISLEDPYLIMNMGISKIITINELNIWLSHGMIKDYKQMETLTNFTKKANNEWFEKFLKRIPKFTDFQKFIHTVKYCEQLDDPYSYSLVNGITERREMVPQILEVICSKNLGGLLCQLIRCWLFEKHPKIGLYFDVIFLSCYELEENFCLKALYEEIPQVFIDYLDTFLYEYSNQFLTFSFTYLEWCVNLFFQWPIISSEHFMKYVIEYIFLSIKKSQDLDKLVLDLKQKHLIRKIDIKLLIEKIWIFKREKPDDDTPIQSKKLVRFVELISGNPEFELRIEHFEFLDFSYSFEILDMPLILKPQIIEIIEILNKINFWTFEFAFGINKENNRITQTHREVLLVYFLRTQQTPPQSVVDLISNYGSNESMKWLYKFKVTPSESILIEIFNRKSIDRLKELKKYGHSLSNYPITAELEGLRFIMHLYYVEKLKISESYLIKCLRESIKLNQLGSIQFLVYFLFEFYPSFILEDSDLEELILRGYKDIFTQCFSRLDENQKFSSYQKFKIQTKKILKSWGF